MVIVMLAALALALAAPPTAPAQKRVDETIRGKAHATARFELYQLALSEKDPDFVYAAFEHLRAPPPDTPAADVDGSRELARRVAESYVVRFSTVNDIYDTRTYVSQWIKAFDESVPFV